jgi:hypothetical protein
MKFLKRVHETQPETRKRVFEFEVGGWFGRFMNRHNWGAFTLPIPFCILILYWNSESVVDGEVNAYARVHEFTHVHQQEGWIFLWGWFKYLWESYRHLSWKSIRANGLGAALMESYRANAYEKEAYLVEELAEKNGLPDWAK